MSAPMSPDTSATQRGAEASSAFRSGVVAILIANVVWGGFPLLFRLLDGVDAPLIVAHRIVWSLLILVVMLGASARLSEIRAVFTNRPLLTRLVVSSLLLALNWLIYVVAVNSGRVLEASFGYFFTPLVNVLMGMVLLGERMTVPQWAAIGIATFAVAIQAVGLGEVPWLALSLAFSFGIYGYLRKTIPVSSSTGLFAETAVLFLPALAYIGYTLGADGVGPHGDVGQLALLFVTGLASVVALVTFAYGAQRLPLSLVGMFQYIAPSLQFILAVTVLGEELNPLRLLSFALIWVSIMVFSWDSYRRRSAVA